jgi:hypothetical protein
MMNAALKGQPALNFHPASNKWLRGTQGIGDGRPLGKMTYKAGDLNTPKVGDPAAPPKNNSAGNKNDQKNNKPNQQNKPNDSATTDPARKQN